ncbi:asparagine synthase (glutamine-hydrolyzing) [Mucilaginibacter sp.]|jgi:asparagine synthase (glutamine-hydrolysing)|uniref:asparagine synthase (glutamine-hydrolyzing) n=1 Tax=Mucilaginibacter sp. TaxID=1882438 RepID=UPI002BF89080|nr:asparagine synthase (glutamine-hydrolyzing) [Mucilaginibacter sp.]HTI60964.1 asparagine synthase (glutamine-hydrolyzing) [Mucilaginibacter sp.]
MCRIAGMISKRLPAAVLREKVTMMCHALEHGGPDDEGIYSDDKTGLVFGHRRLSIIDLSQNGHQPMTDVQQKVWITFNGEIYNYIELKEKLARLGAKFRSNTDTEVIIQAYIHWGMASFSMLRGIFAFGLYDTEKSLTYLVRDSSGVKPLYYYINDGDLSFASEVKALKKAGIATEPDSNWKVRFLAYGHIPEPFTTLKGVFSLPKGEFLCWNHKKGTCDIHSYHVAANKTIITDLDEAHRSIHDALIFAVNRQLIADAPIGVFLSGGTDSSLITLLANQQKHARLKTISIFFNEKAYDERMYQSLILQEIEGEKFAHLVKQQDFEEFLPQIIEDMDMPTTDGINTWFISKYAHDDGLKAVLSGVGADELFGGYPSFNRIKYLKKMRQVPRVSFAAAKYFTSDRYKKISFLAYNHPLADYLLLRGHYAPLDIAKILETDLANVEDILFNDKPMPNIIKYNEEDAAWFETNLYMQNQLLRDTDVMGMSHALEVRVPFLDEDFKKLAESIAPEIRFDMNQPKKILIDSFKDILPRAIWDRSKMGFTFPLQQWMRTHAEINDESLYQSKKAKSIISDFKRNTMHWSKIFALYQIQTHA